MKKNISKDSSSGPVTQEEIDSGVADLARLTSTVSRGAKPLSSPERIRLPRPRKNGASIAREIAQLVQKYGLDGAVPVAGMLSSVEQAERLAPLAKSAANFSVLVDDQAALANAGAWKTSTKAYTFLKRMAKDDPDLARDLEGVAASLKRASAKATSGTPAGAQEETTAATPEAPPVTNGATPLPAPAPTPGK